MPPHARDLTVVPVADGQVLIKRGVTEILVGGDGVEAVVDRVVTLLDGTRDADEVIATLPDTQRAAGRQLLDALASRQLLVHDPGGDGGDPLAPDGPQQAFYANFGATGRSAPAALRRAGVAVHGRGVIASTLVATLADLGVGRVVERGSEPPADLGGVDLVVAASDVGDDQELLALSRRALDAGVPFLPAWLADLVGFVGPLTYPFETACLRCYHLRVDSNERNVEARRALRRHRGTDGEADAGAAAGAGFLPPMAQVVAHVAAVEIALLLGRIAPAGTIARCIEVNLVSFRSSVRRVLKVPRCPDCGEGARRGPRAILTGPQITE